MEQILIYLLQYFKILEYKIKETIMEERHLVYDLLIAAICIGALFSLISYVFV